MSISTKSLIESLGKGNGYATKVHDLLVAGSLKYGGSWGGVACRAHVSLPLHIAESSFWILICFITFKVFSLGQRLSDLQIIAKMELSQKRYENTSRVFDKILAFIHFSMYLQLIYYKWNFSSLINLVQPCHLVLLLEGIALASNGPLGIIISTIILPVLSGTFLALLFPDTTGLDQPFEEISYWIQHYLIIIVPIYLLQRRNGLAYKLSSKYTIGIGLWILLLLHFSFFEVIDLLLSVNVEFMLCPTGAMNSIFSLLPSWLLFPTYRTIITYLVFIIGPLISFAYIMAAKFAIQLKCALLSSEKKIQTSMKKEN